MKMKLCIFKLIFSCCYINLSAGSNILGIFPFPCWSHFKAVYPIFKGLAELNHNVTVVTYNKIDNPHPNYNQIVLNNSETHHIFDLQLRNPTRSIFNMMAEFFRLTNNGTYICEKFFNAKIDEKIFKIHNKTAFDIVIIEMFNTDCILGIAHILSIPVIGISTCALMPWHYDRVGQPDMPSYIPSEFVSFSDDMTFTERLYNFIITKGLKILYKLVEYRDNRILKERLNINTDVNKLSKDVSLLFVNQHYSLTLSRPCSNKVIEIGGVHIDDNNKIIEKDLDAFLNSSNNGVILISWGSMLKISTLSNVTFYNIIAALEKLPQNIIWKWDSGDLKINSNEKFYFNQWIPQKEILCHPKVQLFWSHGGLLGTSEAAYCAKPMIITPIYGDQFLNARAIEKREMGKILYYNNITEETVYEIIIEVLKPNYTVNAKKVSQVFRKRQNSPLNTALWWIQHVIDSKGNSLANSPSVHMNWFVYHSLDAIFFILFIVFVIILVIGFSSKFFYMTFCACTRTKKLKQF